MESKLRILIRERISTIVKEFDNYPAGAKNDPSAPYNQPSALEPANHPSGGPVELLTSVDDIILFKEKGAGGLWAFYFEPDLNTKSAMADYGTPSTEKEWDGDSYVDNYNLSDWIPDSETINNYVNGEWDNLSKGEGIHDWESGNYDLVKVTDQELKDTLDNTLN